MASAEKRCLYEVLSLPTTCSADDIRSSYRRLALQRHPDKLIQSGLTQAEATASFQELVNAYDVLSDPKERSWYDSHRSQILFSTPVSTATKIPDLFSFFSNSAFSGFSDTGKGFYNVYSSVFDKVYANEINFARVMGLYSVKEAPILGNLDSPYYQAKSFFDYWAGFVTVLDFCWADQYDPSSGESRKSRRVMEEENRKSRKKARREYNETVRGLAEFVKKRDKRVIDMLMKKEAETAKRREEEKNRLKQKEKEKADRVRMYQEPAWSRIDEEELQTAEFDEENDENSKKKGELQELYCILCGKKFKSEKQWKNHEQSKKHKEKVVQLRRSVVDREEMPYYGEEKEEEFGDFGGNSVGSVWSEDDSFSVDKLSEKLGEMDGIEEKEEDEEVGISFSEDEQLSFKSSNETFLSLDDSDDENSVLEYIVFANSTGRLCYSAMNDHTELHNDDNDGVENITECDSLKNAMTSTVVKEDGMENLIEVKPSVSNHTIDDPHVENSASHSFTQNNAQNKYEMPHKSEHKIQIQPNKKGATTQQVTKNTKNSVKTTKKKQQQQSSSFSKRNSRSNNSNTCETCGCDFESRNQLHKHLGDTGHASFKYRL